MNRFVYLDNNATTRISTAVQEKIKPYLDLQFGNPSSSYLFGKKVKIAVEDARAQVAKLINAKPNQIVFTSGGSEGNCAAINSAVKQFKNKHKIITTKIEHTSILEYFAILEKEDYRTTYINVNEAGDLDFAELEREIDDDTAGVFIQLANNETGVITNTAELQKVIKAKKKKHNFVFAMDCVQALGKMPLDVTKLGADICVFSGHKIHAPKGNGFMYIKEPKTFVPLIAGHQERGLRGGTENIVGIVAMGEVCSQILTNLALNTQRIAQTRAYLEEQLKKLTNLNINCYNSNRLANTTSVSFKNINGNELMFKLEKFGVCVSTGSACNSESSKPSHVLTAMGIKNAANTIRISIDENTSISHIDYFIEILTKCLKKEK